MANEILQIKTNALELGNQLTQILPPEIAANLETLITIFKTLGIIAIIYLIFLIINIIMNIRRNLMIKEIYKKVNEIENKLNKVLKIKKK